MHSFKSIAVVFYEWRTNGECVKCDWGQWIQVFVVIDPILRGAKCISRHLLPTDVSCLACRWFSLFEQLEYWFTTPTVYRRLWIITPVVVGGGEIEHNNAQVSNTKCTDWPAKHKLSLFLASCPLSHRSCRWESREQHSLLNSLSFA